MPLHNRYETERFTRFSLGFLLLLILLNSINSLNGYFPDQHFQIIEFANFKLGGTGAEDLAWEYKYRERQALQPLLAYGFIKIFHTLGVTDPVSLTQILRVLTGLLMAFGLSQFIKATLHLFRPEYRKAYIAASLLMWFIPCYYVHFGSETFSQLLLLLGCALIFSNKRSAGSLFLIGFFLGLAFFARFQSAITSAILLTGLVWEKRFTFRECLLIAGGIVPALLIGVFADYWLYGEWVLTPYRYLEFQLMKGVVNAFGVSPWYFYMVQLLTSSTIVFGILTYIGFLGSVLSRRLFVFSLSMLGTIALFSAIGHKEGRFMLQILAFFPLIVVYGLQHIGEKFPAFARLLFYRPFYLLLILINLALLGFNTLTNNGIFSSDGGALMGTVTRNYYDREVKLFYTQIDYHPYMIRGFDPEAEEGHFDNMRLRKRFYQPPAYRDQEIDNLSDASVYLESGDSVRLIYINKAIFLSDSARSNVLESGYSLKAASIPLFIDKLLPEGGSAWADRINWRIIYLLEK